MASRLVLVACLCIASNIRFACCERAVNVYFEDVEVKQHTQQDLVRRETQTERGLDLSGILVKVLNSMLPVIGTGTSLPVDGKGNKILPLRVGEDSTGYPGIIAISQSSQPQVGCAATWQDEEGYQQGIIIGNTVLNVDVNFQNFDLSSLLDEKPFLQPMKGLLKLDGTLRAQITVPVQRIGFGLDEHGFWEGFLDEEDAQHIDVIATDFMPGAKSKLDLKALTTELPGWATGGKTNNFLNFIMKTKKIGVWSIIARKVSVKVDEKSMEKLPGGASTRNAVLYATNSYLARGAFSIVSRLGIGRAYCMKEGSSHADA